MHTGDGDLGDRQSHVYHELLKSHDAVILIGGDAPQLSENTLSTTIEQLESHEYVIGPADDGGYYLLAGRKEITPEVWSDTPWSHENTRDILISKLSSVPYQLDVLTDVDTEADLAKMLSEMPKQLNQNQQILKDWIASI